MLAFAGAQEGVWDWNLETGAVVYSPRWKQMLGYGDDEIPANVNAWEKLLHPDDRTRAEALNDAVSAGPADLRRRVPAAPQGRPLHHRAHARPADSTAERRSDRAHRRHPSRHHRAQAHRDGAARERGAPDARVCRRAGGHLGLEPGDGCRACTRRAGSRCSATTTTRSSRTSAPGNGSSIPTTGPSPTRRTRAWRAASRPTRPSSGCGTRTGITSKSCRAGFRSAASPAGRSSGSSARTSISPSAGSARPSTRARSCWPTSCSCRRTSAGASPATCTISSASS